MEERSEKERKKGFSNNLTGIKGNDKAKHIIGRLHVQIHSISLSFWSPVPTLECKWMQKGSHSGIGTEHTVLTTEFVYIIFECMRMIQVHTKFDRKKSCVFFDDKKKSLDIRPKWNYPSKKKRRSGGKKNEDSKKHRIRLWITWLLFPRLVHWARNASACVGVGVDVSLCRSLFLLVYACAFVWVFLQLWGWQMFH